MKNYDFDKKYMDIILEPLRKCADYKPKFGSAEELDLNGFMNLYNDDIIYSSVGLNSPLMYSAHKAAGGMTSIYRQLGVGCENLVKTIIRDELNLTKDQTSWIYEIKDENGKTKKLTLDARIDINDLSGERKLIFKAWLEKAALSLGINEPEKLNGVIFEIRQGYKSADAKRQNADLNFAIRAKNNNYLPAVMVVSSQVSDPVIKRYKAAAILVLTGNNNIDDSVGTLSFFDNIIGFSLEQFFIRNNEMLQKETNLILKKLLSPDI